MGGRTNERIQMAEGIHFSLTKGFPGGTVVQNPPAKAGDARDTGSILGPGRSAGARNGNPLLSPCLENSMVRGAWWATVPGVTELDTTEHARNQHCQAKGPAEKKASVSAPAPLATLPLSEACGDNFSLFTHILNTLGSSSPGV